MTEKNHVQTMLAELVEHELPVDIDVDEHIVKGRRRVQRRTALVCVAALAVPLLAVGGIYALRPDVKHTEEIMPVANVPGERVLGTPEIPWANAPRIGDLPADKPTAKSKLLGRQFARLIPELADYPHSSLATAAGPTERSRRHT